MLNYLSETVLLGFAIALPNQRANFVKSLERRIIKGYRPLLANYAGILTPSLVEIRNPKEFAYESGFSGSRAEATWRSRMRRLEELGFIMTKAGMAGDFQYVLILNPIQVIERKYKDRLKGHEYNALIGRLDQIGADDLDFDKLR